jgi:hypothetical protein
MDCSEENDAWQKDRPRLSTQEKKILEGVAVETLHEGCQPGIKRRPSRENLKKALSSSSVAEARCLCQGSCPCQDELAVIGTLLAIWHAMGITR